MHTTSAEKPTIADRNTSHLKTRITLVGAVVNLLLAGIKIVVGVIGHSQALVADGIHSLSDLLSDAVVLFASHSGSKAADAEHPYGHARFETVATVVIGVMLLIVAGSFIYDAVLRLLDPAQLQVPSWVVLPAAIISVLANEALYHYTARVGRRVGSRLIEANAWHHRSDALSSLIVIGAFSGGLVGLTWLDAVAAIIVATMFGVMGWQFVWQSTRELVDTGADPQTLEELAKVIDTVDGVRSHHDLRTRLMAGKVLIDVHLLVDPWISVSEGHRIGEEARRRLIEQTSQASEVLVHVDTQKPSDTAASLPPLRHQILADLMDAWVDLPEADYLSRVTLHYLGSRAQVVLELPAKHVDSCQLDEIEDRFQRAAVQLTYIESIRCLLATSRESRYDKTTLQPSAQAAGS
ncbi:cation transporter [Pistricoccus aurantiacus]|uniref:Cation transporter n=1 Tax=Pistricoccus aurantiacus TaxID=1883414 RepID=A0A5B8T0K0_9GAMM|nr:cation diffusion facilitator family transporter [Pistricoccus aurantiacus]QEA40578.1 cation transporter [Pistricoccus aurantiacus]